MSPRFDQGFTHVFLVTFRDAAAREADLPHPAHMESVKIRIAGDRDEVKARVAELEGVVDVAILEAPSWRCSGEQILASHRAVIEAFV